MAVLHANVGDVAEHAAYSPCRLDDLVGTGHDYWALGHIHRRAILRAARPLVAYPGNLQGRSFKPSETGPKGALLVEVADGEPVTRFVDLAPIRFEEIAVDVSACEDLGAVCDALVETAEALVGGDRLIVLRARVFGATAAYDILVRPEASDVLTRALGERGGALPQVHWADLALDVGPPIDLAALRGRGDLLGELADEATRLSEDRLALRGLLAQEEALRPLLGEMDDAALAALVWRAAELAVSLLDEEV